MASCDRVERKLKRWVYIRNPKFCKDLTYTKEACFCG